MTHAWTHGSALLAPALLLVALAGPVGATSAEPVLCPSIDISVQGADEALTDQICGGAERALTALDSCHLTQAQPISISVLPEVIHPTTGMHCLALANCIDQSIQVTHPDFIAAAVTANPVYSQIPTEDLFISLIAHELTHLLISQTTAANLNPTDHEYMAYAMQISSLPAASRQVLLDQVRDPTAVNPGWINDFILNFKPTLFAAYVWLNFSRSENGCAQFQRLMDREITFELISY